ncbi:hypothetical protein JWG44_19350 [Leptospira sp. 201903071]|uniref:hypothetical protein n=1 Tax=Leptospira ainazelensis TaxID=2810034 RepID=UPI0019627E17|nr:hypothetical protein [Leptospira ainazelensis]MBM9502412.1 hypothetical protein [Leptospira ainazelensis]
MKTISAKILYITIFLFINSFINAQNDIKTNTGTDSVENSKVVSPMSGKSMLRYLESFDHRLRVRIGAGMGDLSPAILDETGPSWLKNSLFRQIGDPGAPLAIPYTSAKNLDIFSQHADISYGWKNKIDLILSQDGVSGKYGRENPASVNFFSPRTDRYYTSAFEGKRLMNFRGVSRTLRLSYTHPILNWLMIGPSIGIHRYSEKNEVSFGSYSVTRENEANPNQVTWSIGGSVNAEYTMSGILPGIFVKAKILPWLEIRSRFELLNRKGNFSLFGSQILEQQNTSGLLGAVPIYAGNAKDTGTIFMLEASLRYCRFSLDIGIVRQDIKRKYNSYFGDTAGSIARADYTAGSQGIGFSELSSSYKQTVNEIYIMPGVSFHMENGRIY